MIKDLSLREKILQTVVLRHKNDRPITEKAGAVYFGGEIITGAENMGMDQAREILARYQENSDIPMLITSDFENAGGNVLKGLTVLPYLSSLGATNNLQLAYDYGKVTALDARSIGANWSFSPVCDLYTNPRNPIINVRALTDDPALASPMLKQVIRGMQENGLAACAKHFPGDGVDYRDQHIVTTCNSLSIEQWWQQHGKVFADVIEAGVMTIMPGHITLPAYQKEKHLRGLPLPATLSSELIDNLLKKEMGFEGIVVTDALDMGGFNGWYKTRRQSEVEAFKAGCDMMLWPTEHYVDDMVEAVENGYVSMERLDDAVGRILLVKEKMGLFGGNNRAVSLTEEEVMYIESVQREIAEKSITLVRDENAQFPITSERYKKITVVPVTHHTPALQEAELLCRELEDRGFAVNYRPTAIKFAELDENMGQSDLVLVALFSRGHRPIGFLDFHDAEAMKIWKTLYVAGEKTVVVSFGSPHFGAQYFERAHTYVNAYSMVASSVKAFVRAATGEIPFSDFHPVKL